MTIGPSSFPPLSPYSGVQRPSQPQSPQVASAPGAAAPAGSTLWHLLSAAEQAHFLEAAAAGPLSYGRGGEAGPAAPAPRGQFLDVRA